MGLQTQSHFACTCASRALSFTSEWRWTLGMVSLVEVVMAHLQLATVVPGHVAVLALAHNISL